MTATALGAIGQAISMANRLREISKTVENAEFSALLADLQLELAEAKVRIADLLLQNSELRTQLSALEKAKDSAEEMVYDGRVYRKQGDESAYCPTCFDSDGKAIRLGKLSPPLNRLADFLCGKCSTTIKR